MNTKWFQWDFFVFGTELSRYPCGFALKSWWHSVKSWNPIHAITPRHHTHTPLNPRTSVFSSHPQSNSQTNSRKIFHFLCFSPVFLCFFSVFLSLSHIKMEGLIPFVYKAIMQYKNGREGPIVSWLCDSPSYSYMKLPGDSGRFQTSASSLFGSDYGLSSSSSSSSKPASSTTQIMVSSHVQSPSCHLNSPRVPTWTSTCFGTWMWLLLVLLSVVQVCLFKWFKFGPSLSLQACG